MLAANVTSQTNLEIDQASPLPSPPSFNFADLLMQLLAANPQAPMVGAIDIPQKVPESTKDENTTSPGSGTTKGAPRGNKEKAPEISAGPMQLINTAAAVVATALVMPNVGGPPVQSNAPSSAIPSQSTVKAGPPLKDAKPSSGQAELLSPDRNTQMKNVQLNLLGSAHLQRAISQFESPQTQGLIDEKLHPSGETSGYDQSSTVRELGVHPAASSETRPQIAVGALSIGDMKSVKDESSQGDQVKSKAPATAAQNHAKKSQPEDVAADESLNLSIKVLKAVESSSGSILSVSRDTQPIRPAQSTALDDASTKAPSAGVPAVKSEAGAENIEAIRAMGARALPSQLQISAETQHLGAVQVRAQLRGVGLETTISVERPEAASVLAAAAPELKQQLAAKNGYEVSVVVQGWGSSMSGDGGPPHKDQQLPEYYKATPATIGDHEDEQDEQIIARRGWRA